MAAWALIRWGLNLIGACLFVAAAILLGGVANWTAWHLLHGSVPAYSNNDPLLQIILGACVGLVFAVSFLRQRGPR